MTVVLSCDDCGRGYALTDFLRPADRYGSRPLQCPNCFAVIGRTKQADDPL